jgi:hypothetical protein
MSRGSSMKWGMNQRSNKADEASETERSTKTDW